MVAEHEPGLQIRPVIHEIQRDERRGWDYLDSLGPDFARYAGAVLNVPDGTSGSSYRYAIDFPDLCPPVFPHMRARDRYGKVHLVTHVDASFRELAEASHIAALCPRDTAAQADYAAKWQAASNWFIHTLKSYGVTE